MTKRSTLLLGFSLALLLIGLVAANEFKDTLITSGYLWLSDDVPLIFGDATTGSIEHDSSIDRLVLNAPGQGLQMPTCGILCTGLLLRGTGLWNAITIESSNSGINFTDGVWNVPNDTFDDVTLQYSLFRADPGNALTLRVFNSTNDPQTFFPASMNTDGAITLNTDTTVTDDKRIYWGDSDDAWTRYVSTSDVFEIGLGLGSVLSADKATGDISISNNAHIADNKRLYCGTDDDSWVRYSSTTAALEVGIGGDVALAVDADADATITKALSATGEIHITGDDTTPSVAGAFAAWIDPDSWTTGNNITSFDDGKPGQLLFVIGNDSDCVIESGTGNIVLPGGNWTADSASLTVYYTGDLWLEVSRAVAPPN